MAISPKMELRPSQALVMTPQLQQAIKLLQLSNLELSAYIEQELERNPALERAEGEDGDAGAGADLEAKGLDGSGQAEPKDAAAVPLDRLDLGSGGGLDGADAPLDASYENVFDDDGAGTFDTAASAEPPAWSEIRAPGAEFDEDMAPFDPAAGNGIGLNEHLLTQLNLLLAGPDERLIGAHLVESLDEA
ncbi:MAG TPA: RNA polymerase sigma-54 factor, partial [Alphaproteobacteria bacterium]|nr:RNA polymerase sigma-54 factor [Alphaproteobacteria bacterium]